MGMKTYDSYDVSFFPEEVKMILPDGYRIDTDYDDEGNENYNLRGGFYINDDGDEDFSFTCSFIKMNVNRTFEGDEQTLKKLNDPSDPEFVFNQIIEGVMENLQEQFGTGKAIKLYNSLPPSALMKFYKPVSLFGVTVDTDVFFLLFEVNESTAFGLNTVYQKESTGSERFYDHLFNVMQSVRVNDKPLDTRKLTPKKIENALDMERDENVDALDLGVSIGINIQAGEEETKLTLNSDGSVTEEKINTALEYVSPDESLYPHYNSMLRAQGFGLFGATVVVNQDGTEYKFYQIRGEFDEEEELNENLKLAISKLNDTEAAAYKLADKSVEMRSVFHVSPGAFDLRHDRECELADGYMHRAYMMSALRSFAWTLSKYCEDMSVNPDELSLEQIQRIVDFVADRNWLNYDGSSYCESLCGTSDLHVFYLPDNTPASVQTAFEPSQETLEETKRLQEKMPGYNPILHQVGSLDGLRRDLNYIYPAIELIYKDLKSKRNNDEPLLGNDADILYAWCALAYAARGPFFSEDGPTMCYFTQEVSEEERREELEKERVKYSKTWMDSYGQYIEKNPIIEFKDKKFVFSGLGYRYHSMEDHTDYGKLIEDKGGLTRKSVSGVTDYLVVEPAGAGEGKINDAIEQQKNNKPIKVILLQDLRKEFGLADEQPTDTEVRADNMSTETSAVSERQSQKPAATQSETVIVGDTWAVDIPAGYKYCTDKSIIGEHRDIIFMEDKKGNEFGDPYNASVSFTSAHIESENLPGTRMAKMATNFMTENSVKELRNDDKLYVAYFFSDSTYADGDKLDIFKIQIGYAAGTSSIQVFFIDSGLTRRQQHAFVEEVSKSIKLKSEVTKTNRVAETKAKDNSTDNEIKMFVVLTNDEQMGKSDRKNNEFYKKYEKDFPDLKKKELLALRETVLSKMHDEAYRTSCKKTVMNSSLNNRFLRVTKGYFNATDTAEYSQRAGEAVDKTADWYSESEKVEVKRMMNAEMDRIKNQIDNQLSVIEPKWTKWDTAKDDLKVFIRSKDDPQVELSEDCRLFQVQKRDDIAELKLVVEVLLCNGDNYQTRVRVMDAFPMYWGISYEEIWKKAIANEIVRKVEGLYDSHYEIHAKEALSKVRKKYPTVAMLKRKQKAAEKAAAEAKQPVPLSEIETLCLYAIADYEQNRGKKVFVSGIYGKYKDNTNFFKKLKQKQIARAFEEMEEAVSNNRPEVEEYERGFRALSIDERFQYITQPVFEHNYFHNYLEQQREKYIHEALDYTRKWYDPCELIYVEKKLTKMLQDYGAEIDKKFEEQNTTYMKDYNSIKDNLVIELRKKVIKTNKFAEIDDGEYRCELKTKVGFEGIFSVYYNETLPWYWGVSKAEVWKNAFRNSDQFISWISQLEDMSQEEAKRIVEKYVRIASQDTYVPDNPYDRSILYAEIEPYDVVLENVKNEYGHVSPDTMKSYLDARDDNARAEKERKARAEENEAIRKQAQKLMKDGTINSLYKALELFREIENDVDVEQEIISCENRISAAKKRHEQKAHYNEGKKLEADGTVSSLKLAASQYELAEDYQDAAERATWCLNQAQLRANEARQELNELQNALLKLKTQHAQLGGFFKKKQRLEVEESIRLCEQRIKEYKHILGE